MGMAGAVLRPNELEALAQEQREAEVAEVSGEAGQGGLCGVWRGPVPGGTERLVPRGRECQGQTCG